MIIANGQSMSGLGMLHNTGSILVAGGLGQASKTDALNNLGLLDVTSGTLLLNGGASSGYGIKPATGGTMAFGGGDFVITDGFFAPGAIDVVGGTLDVSAASVTVIVNSASLANGLLNLGTLSIMDQGTFARTGGTLVTSGTFSVIIGGAFMGGTIAGGGTVELLRTSLFASNGGGSSSGDGIYTAPGGTLEIGVASSFGEAFSIDGGFFAPTNTWIEGGTLDVSGAGAAVFSRSLGLTFGELTLGTLVVADQGSFSQSGGTIDRSGTFDI